MNARPQEKATGRRGLKKAFKITLIPIFRYVPFKEALTKRIGTPKKDFKKAFKITLIPIFRYVPFKKAFKKRIGTPKKALKGRRMKLPCYSA